MLFGYGLLLPVSSGRIGSTSGVSASFGSAASIGQLVARAPSDSLKLVGDGVVNTKPLLAAPTDRLWPVPMTPSQTGLTPPSPPGPPPPQPIPTTASTRAAARVGVVRSARRIARRSLLPGRATAPKNDDGGARAPLDDDDVALARARTLPGAVPGLDVQRRRRVDQLGNIEVDLAVGAAGGGVHVTPEGVLGQRRIGEQVVVQRPAVDDDQRPPGRARQQQPLADRPFQMLVGDRQQPIVIDGAAAARQDAVLVAADVENGR